MSRRYEVDFSDEAWFTIDAHVRYVALTLKSPLNAARWLRRLLDTVDGLSEMPTRFAMDEDESERTNRSVYRLTFEGTCVLLYTVDESSALVEIVSFHHGGHA